jgi:hypothetical protein
VCSKTETATPTCGVGNIAANSCPFTNYNAPPSPWVLTSSTISGSTARYVFNNSQPDRRIVCPTVKYDSAPQVKIGLDGQTYTSGWKITGLSGFRSFDAQVYCHFMPESLH